MAPTAKKIVSTRTPEYNYIYVKKIKFCTQYFHRNIEVRSRLDTMVLVSSPSYPTFSAASASPLHHFFFAIIIFFFLRSNKQQIFNHVTFSPQGKDDYKKKWIITVTTFTRNSKGSPRIAIKKRDTDERRWHLHKNPG